jgi:hypothetical protein
MSDVAKPGARKYDSLYSLMGDWRMFWQIVTGKIAL